MKRLMRHHTHRAKPSATRMRSSGVSNTDQIFSICGMATRAVRTARAMMKRVRKATPPMKTLYVGFGVVRLAATMGIPCLRFVQRCANREKVSEIAMQRQEVSGESQMTALLTFAVTPESRGLFLALAAFAALILPAQ